MWHALFIKFRFLLILAKFQIVVRVQGIYIQQVSEVLLKASGCLGRMCQYFYFRQK